MGRDGRSCSSFRSHSPGAVPPCDIPTMASTTTPTTTDQQRHAFSTLLWVKVGYIWLYNVIQCYTTLYICWLYNRWLLFFINHWFFAPPHTSTSTTWSPGRCLLGTGLCGHFKQKGARLAVAIRMACRAHLGTSQGWNGWNLRRALGEKSTGWWFQPP